MAAAVILLPVDLRCPRQRQDILAGLEALAAEPAVDERGMDPRWPNLDNAVHWVVDDTGWDQNDPSKSVGDWLVDEGEAEAVALVVSLIRELSDRHGAEAVDADWFSDPTWPQVKDAATRAVAAMRRNGG